MIKGTTTKVLADLVHKDYNVIPLDSLQILSKHVVLCLDLNSDPVKVIMHVFCSSSIIIISFNKIKISYT